MAIRDQNEVLQRLRRAALLGGAELTDGQLLEHFLGRREEVYLAALVRRHGPMVWGVCRRVLHNHHDAEDAFQATFLVLVRKAKSIVPREMVANWLYGVAHQTALKARATIAKRRSRERQVTHMPEMEAMQQDPWNDLQPLLDRELSRLPDRHRLPIVLCDLEGKTRQEVARQLGVPEGTVASRLARARTQLARRLARHGLAVSGGTLAVVLAREASAGVPSAVLSGTIKAMALVAAGQAVTAGAVSANVAALTEGVMKAMLLSKLQTVTAVLLLVSVVAFGGVLVCQQTATAQPNGIAPVVGSRENREASDKLKSIDTKDNATKKELERLEGTWDKDSLEYKGKPQQVVGPSQYVFKGDKFTFIDRGTEYYKGVLKVDPTLKTIDLVITDGEEKGTTLLGLYELDGDALKICLGPGGEVRPKELKTAADSTAKIWTYKRKPAEQPKADKGPTSELRGTWVLSATEYDGLRLGEGRPEIKDGKAIVEGNKLTLGDKDGRRTFDIKVDAAKRPKEMLLLGDKVFRGIYEVDRGSLRICFARDTEPVPADFTAAFGSKRWLYVFKRDKTEQALLDLKMLTEAVETYKITHGQYPESLEAMVANPLSGDASNVDPNILKDPWGRPYYYDRSGKKNRGVKADIWSEGPDEQDQRIGNWEKEKPAKVDKQ
jgi:RNA polymerase sigma factor (sigma-70 family)